MGGLEPRWWQDLVAGRTLRGDGVPVVYSDHCVDRWAERMGRDLERATAERQLWQVAAVGAISKEPPDWLRPQPDHHNVAYLSLGDDLAAPLSRVRRPNGRQYLVATTLMMVAGVADVEREKKQAKGRQVRQKKTEIRKWKKVATRSNHQREALKVERPRKREWGAEE